MRRADGARWWERRGSRCGRVGARNRIHCAIDCVWLFRAKDHHSLITRAARSCAWIKSLCAKRSKARRSRSKRPHFRLCAHIEPSILGRESKRAKGLWKIRFACSSAISFLCYTRRSSSALCLWRLACRRKRVTRRKVDSKTQHHVSQMLTGQRQGWHFQIVSFYLNAKIKTVDNK
jgi:hypothetical protein